MSRTRWNRLRFRHPEWWVWPVAATGAVTHALLGHGGGAAPASVHHHHDMAGTPSSSAVPALVMWLAMVAVMTVPMNVPGVRYVAFSSLPDRRARAMAWYVLGLVAVWLPLGSLAVVLHDRDVDLRVVAAAAVAAVAFELSPLKRAALTRCRRTRPIRVRGAAAAASCVRFGAFGGVNCVATCGPAMAVILLAGHPTWAMLGYTAYALGRRYGLLARRRPRPQPVSPSGRRRVLPAPSPQAVEVA